VPVAVTRNEAESPSSTSVLAGCSTISGKTAVCTVGAGLFPFDEPPPQAGISARPQKVAGILRKFRRCKLNSAVYFLLDFIFYA